MPTTDNISATVSELGRLLTASGEQDYIGEAVSQLEHALQAAALSQSKNDPELTLAALLHDVGHFCFPDQATMADVGVLHHEQIAADYLLGLGFSPRLCKLVEGHVNAKRYLVTTNPNYLAQLSEASLKTLEYQGGLMTPTEVDAFEQDTDFKAMLQLRAWDDAAKVPNLPVPGLDAYQPLMESHLAEQQLTAEQCKSFQDNGFLHLKGVFSESQISRLVAKVTDMQEWPETAGKWMKYFETAEDSARLLCRIENFIDYDVLFKHLITGPLVIGWISQLMDEPGCLFKEKINFKLPGGAGFAPHQDAPAFTFANQDYHITMMLSFDASNTQNGCLEVVPGHWPNKFLAMEADKTINQDVSQTLDWQPLETSPGDIVLFGSYIPHRSGPNLTDQSRRALYATYNKAAQGQVRAEYFSQKRQVFPPDIERIAGVDYGDSGIFNVANPIR